jgi:hypothetical protein
MSKDIKLNPLEILSVKQAKTDIKTKVPKPLPYSNGKPFTLCITAPSASGKSVLLVNLLYRYYKPEFDEIYYISPTIMHDKTLENNVKTDDEIIKIYEEEDLNNIDEVLKHIVDEIGKEEKKVLIILDDMIAYFKNQSYLNKIVALSRHYDVSFIITCQAYMSFPNILRKNASHHIIFRIFNKKDLEAIEDEIGTNYEDYDEYYKEATKDKYSFLYITQRDPKLYKRFVELLWERYKD